MCGLLFLFADAVAEGLQRGSAVHAAALVRSAGIVADEIVVEHPLHLVDGLEPGLATLDAEVFVEQGSMEAFGDAV